MSLVESFFSLVTLGLDPSAYTPTMDGRVKPGHDSRGDAS
jgi:hypothetical protein